MSHPHRTDVAGAGGYNYDRELLLHSYRFLGSLDGDGRRVVQSRSDGVTVAYVNDLLEVEIDSYYYLPRPSGSSVASGAVAANGSRGSVTAFVGGTARLAFTQGVVAFGADGAGSAGAIRQTLTTLRFYYFANGQPIALREVVHDGALTTLYYLHHDHLGSTSLVTDASGEVVARQAYLPFGAVRADQSQGTLPTQRGFTGHYADSYTELILMGSRYLDPRLGRWIQPDSIVPEPGNPQTLNRYSYVNNRPLVLTDPSGHCPVCLVIGVTIALAVWLANPEPAYAPEPGWVPSSADDPNYGDKAFFDAAPGTGDLSDAYTVATGHTLFTGEDVQGVDRLLAVGGTLLPGFTIGGFRLGRKFIKGIDNIVPGSRVAVRRIANPLTDSLKNALYRQARDIFFNVNPGLPRSLEVHHRLPLEWAHLFPDADPNRLANLVGLDPGIHDQVGTMWTAFRQQHPGATAQDVMLFLAEVDQQYGQYYNQVLSTTP